MTIITGCRGGGGGGEWSILKMFKTVSKQPALQTFSWPICQLSFVWKNDDDTVR